MRGQAWQGWTILHLASSRNDEYAKGVIQDEDNKNACQLPCVDLEGARGKGLVPSDKGQWRYHPSVGFALSRDTISSDWDIEKASCTMSFVVGEGEGGGAQH